MGSPPGEGDAQRVHGKARGKHVPRPGLTARKESNQLLRGGRDFHDHKMHVAAGDQQESRHKSGRWSRPLTAGELAGIFLNNAGVGVATTWREQRSGTRTSL